MQLYQNTVQDRNGNVITGASVLVKTYPGAVTATIYSTNTGTAASNPLTTDSDGQYSFYAADGQYTTTVSKSGITTETSDPFLLRDSPVDVKGFGATGDGSTDDTAAIQAAITANAGKAIYFPPGTYKTTGVINITSDYTRLVGAGSGATQIRMYTSTTADQFKFAPAGALATDGTKLAQNGISGMYIYRFTDGTTGAGVHCLQCTGFQMDDVRILDYPEGLKVLGGTLNNFTNFSVFSTDNLTGAPVASSSLVSFTEAPLDAAAYQVPYTTTVSNFKIAGTRHIDAMVIVRACDGLAFSNGYIGNGYNANIRLKAQTANMSLGALTFTNVYVDGVVATTSGTVYGVDIPSDSVASAVVAYVGFENCDFANYQTAGFLCTEGFILLGINNCRFYNIRGWGLNITGSNTTSHLLFTNNQVYNCANVTASTGGILVSTLVDCTITNNQFSNLSTAGSDTAVSLTGTNVNGVIDNNTFYNCTTKVTNGATWTGVICGVPVTWTPALTFATNGDLSLQDVVQ